MVAPRPSRPARLRQGDTVAVLSPSWGGPFAFPHVFDHGLRVLRDWGLVVREYPSTRAPAEVLAADPALRARDINDAFADPGVQAIIASIGGDDSIRLLSMLDAAAIAANPKILLGYSDTTTLLAAVRHTGVVTLHGPSVMAGLSQLRSLPGSAEHHLRQMLFEPAGTLTYPDLNLVAHGYPDWRDPAQTGLVNALRPAGGWRVLQGSGPVQGELYGGCLEVLDWLRGTSAWPTPEAWAGRLLFIETSELKPSPDQVASILRAFGVLGVFDGITGLMLGRPRDHDHAEAAELEAAVLGVVAHEFGRADLPIAANLPFGHTDPQWVLPIGVEAELDVDARTLRLVEPWLA